MPYRIDRRAYADTLRETGENRAFYETAVDELDGFITYAGTLPVFSELWAEPRFQAVLERMNLTRPS